MQQKVVKFLKGDAVIVAENRGKCNLDGAGGQCYTNFKGFGLGVRGRLMDRWEMKLYELLGIRLFRRLAFGMERLIHRKDRRKNINYHISAHTPGGLAAFRKYLFYNAAIHAKGILLVGIVLLIKWGFLGFTWYFDSLLLLLAVQDGYCIMLQRYNYLRIRQHMAVLEQKREEKLRRRGMLLTDYLRNVKYNKAEAREALAFINRIRRSIRTGDNLILTEEDMIRLVGLKQLLGAAQEGGDA